DGLRIKTVEVLLGYLPIQGEAEAGEGSNNEERASMTNNPEKIAEALRSWAGSIPQVEGEPPCEQSRLLTDAAAVIEQLHKEKERLELLVAEFGEVASAAAFYARQVHNAADQAGRKAAYINQKAM